MDDLLADWRRWSRMERLLVIALGALVSLAVPVFVLMVK